MYPHVMQISKLEAATSEVDTELIEKQKNEIAELNKQSKEMKKDKQELTGAFIVLFINYFVFIAHA